MIISNEIEIIGSKKRGINDSESKKNVEEDKTQSSKKLIRNDGSSSKSNTSSAQKAQSKEIEQKMENIKLPEKDLDRIKPPSSPFFDPIEDAPYFKDQPMPFSFIAKALVEVENCKGQNSKDAIKEIIGNVFRSSILLNPSELPLLFYFCIVKLSPDYEGLETGIGHEQLLKAVAKSTGKSAKQIREQF